MSIHPDTKYNGVIGPGSALIETQQGTVGYQVMIGCKDGETTFTIWLTEKNHDRAIKYFDVLGIRSDLLQDPNYVEFRLSQEIEGKEISFGTKEEEYNGKKSIKVVWIGRKSEEKLSNAAARFFGATITDTPSKILVPGTESITDDDLPF
jgi:hypothetical protein